jgi:hypothetical protein
MLDRQKLEAVLSKRFPDAKREQVAAAANAIMGLPDEWEEVGDFADAHRTAETAVEFRILRRRGF